MGKELACARHSLELVTVKDPERHFQMHAEVCIGGNEVLVIHNSGSYSRSEEDRQI